MLAAMLPAPVALAGEDSTGGVFPTHDDNSLEVGVWWVEDYPPAGSGGPDLPATRPDALGLRNELHSTCRLRIFGICIWHWPTPTWTPRYVYGNGNAWESDWTTHENNYVDRVDLAYFAGHGWSGGFVFGAGGRNHNDPYVQYGEVQNKWGDRDLDWMGIAACNVLEDSHKVNWARTMKGLRLLMGFVTTMADVPHGEKFGKYIRLNYTMTQAWFRAADDLQPQHKIARVLAEEPWMFNDRWYNHRSTDYYDNIYWWWTHTVGSEPARYVNADGLQAMPVFLTQPLALAEANSEWNTLGAATGVTTTNYVTSTTPIAVHGAGIVQEGGAIRSSEDGQLIMDEQNGLFNYTNATDLWTAPSATAANATAMQSISQDQAKQIADQFLTQNGLMPGDASYFEVAEETLSAGSNASGVTAASASAVLTETVMSHQVLYSRHVTGTATLRDRAVAAPMTFSVMGPGSKLKVYVAAQAPVSVTAASLLQTAVDGAMGGYRRIQQPTDRATGAPLTEPILSFSQVSPMVTYLNQANQPELENMFGLSVIPLPDIKQRTIVTNTLAYWEGPQGWSQGQLIPVHSIGVRNDLEDGTIVTSTAYIPASAAYMAPLARIDAAKMGDGSDIPTPVTLGSSLVFTATDASQTLATAGYDAAMNYTPGNGPFVYRWYVDTVSDATKVGDGQTLNYTVIAPTGQPKDGQAVQTIILEVVDLGAKGDPGRNYSRYPLMVVPPVFVPLVER